MLRIPFTPCLYQPPAADSNTSPPKQKHKAMQAMQAMQATLNIDDKLFEEAAKIAATENQSQLIEIALSEFIKNHQQAQKRDVRDLVGKVEIAPDYDYKKLRTGGQ
jgi:hypothetical protein